MPQSNSPLAQRLRKFLKEFPKTLGILLTVYVLAYVLNSAGGGYWLQPRMDGTHRYKPEFGGLAFMDAILWEPRFGRNALGDLDYLGCLFEPLIWADRKWLHTTHYLDDDEFDAWIKRLPVSKVHPIWRDDFVTRLEVSMMRNETEHALQCKLRLTGSDHPRVITEIWMPRELAVASESSPPTGFAEVAFQEYRSWRSNKTIRWVGQTSLVRDEDVVLSIPSNQPKAGTGKIVFTYRRKDKPDDGGSLKFVTLDPP